ncbi:SDR family NAD(P)-dependent oxidoreductase [Sphingobium aromaticivastans]|uniref:SDR family NAD(P)-dependent oxidoreductase n=1 Tax=Sphingobium aromaticivastans TaxID=1778665 RepID=UPI003017EB76
MTEGRTWLITGVSRGLGLALARAVLARGDRLLGTSRDGVVPAELADMAGLSMMAFDLSTDDPVELVRHAEQTMGGIDILVNNAGYALIGAVEDVDAAALADQFQVNFLAPLALVRAALPLMRAQGSGHIINLSSVAAICPSAGSALYAASKAALSALSVGLAMEVEPLGIRVTAIEPGAFRTDFLSEHSLRRSDAAIADYAGTTGAFFGKLRSFSGSQGGDPEKAAQAICDVVDQENPPRRLILGSDGLGYATGVLEQQLADMQRLGDISRSTDIA